jgi:pilus assembly protein CpaB
MRAKSVLLLILALACGGVASLGITRVIAQRGTDSAPAAETQSIFVVSKDVPQGDPLTAQELKLEQWPKDKLIPGALSRLEDIEGRRTRTKLYAGEPILDGKLAAKGVNAPGADIMIPKGYRVVSIRVDAVSGGGNLLLPGCRVDLLVHMAKNASLGIRETTTRTILQDIKVFAVNDVVNLDANGPETKSIQARTVSLLVTPAQAEKVTLATELGSIKLVMRGPEEEAEVQTEGALPHELFGDSDKANRDKEDMTTQPTRLESLKEQGKGFLDYLNALREKANVEKPAPAEPVQETWSMRVLAGADVKDVTLRGPASTGPDAGYWTLSDGKPAGANGGKNAPEVKVPPLPEEKQPAKTGTLPGDSGPGGHGNQAGQPGSGSSSGAAPAPS